MVSTYSRSKSADDSCKSQKFLGRRFYDIFSYAFLVKAKEGACSTSRPGFWDPVGRAKWLVNFFCCAALSRQHGHFYELFTCKSWFKQPRRCEYEIEKFALLSELDFLGCLSTTGNQLLLFPMWRGVCHSFSPLMGILKVM